MRGFVALGIFAGFAVQACSPGITATPKSTATVSMERPALYVVNDTTIIVTLIVDDTVVLSVPPEVHEALLAARLPPLPWEVQVRSPSGVTLLRLSIRTVDPIGSDFGRSARVDLACGTLEVWTGPPMVGGTFLPSSPGSCE
jgi:hypothetical protein